MKKIIKKLFNKLPYISTLVKELEIYKKGYPPGHYYSPVISPEEVKEQEDVLFAFNTNTIL